MNPEVDQYLLEGCGRCKWAATPQCKVHKWESELKQLRALVLQCGLIEVRKWGMPCYMYQRTNVLMIAAFKEYCALSFFKGSLLGNESGLLQAPGENSQSTRQLRFTDIADIRAHKDEIKALIFEAVELEKSGKKVVMKTTDEFEVPEEFQCRLTEMPALKMAFEGLTPGRRRAYLLWFTQAKQSKTRISRIEKCIPAILSGKGLND